MIRLALHENMANRLTEVQLTELRDKVFKSLEDQYTSSSEHNGFQTSVDAATSMLAIEWAETHEFSWSLSRHGPTYTVEIFYRSPDSEKAAGAPSVIFPDSFAIRPDVKPPEGHLDVTRPSENRRKVS